MLFCLFVTAHAILTFCTDYWSMGWAIALLDSGYKQAPLGLSVLSLIAFAFRLPLTYLVDILLLKLGFYDPIAPIYWVSIPINSFLVVWILYRGLRAARGHYIVPAQR